MFEKVQSLPENNGNSCLMTAACHALGSRPFVLGAARTAWNLIPERCRGWHEHGTVPRAWTRPGRSSRPRAGAERAWLCGEGCGFPQDWGVCEGLPAGRKQLLQS